MQVLLLKKLLKQYAKHITIVVALGGGAAMTIGMNDNGQVNVTVTEQK